jgi:hypothetical protein
MDRITEYGGRCWKAEPGLTFYATEALASGVLAQEARIEGVPCAAGEEVEFHPEGGLACAILARDAVVQGLPARAGTPVAFYADGTLRFVVLSQPRRVRGFPAAAGNLFLHPDGSVWNGLTSGEARIGRAQVPARTRMTFDAHGRPVEFWRALEVDTEIQGLPCSARFPVWFYPDGRLSCLHLARPFRVDGHRLAANTEVVLGNAGELLAAYPRRYPRLGSVPWRVFGAIDEPLYG